MLRPVFVSLVLGALLVTSSHLSGQARGNDWSITDGSGEQFVIKNKFFGRSDKVVKDRLGDGVALKKGFFGSKETDVNVLGNQFQAKKGWFGSSDIKGHDILGDGIKTRKGFFGRRTTTVDLSGASSVLGGLFSGANKRPPMPMPMSPQMDRPGAASDPLTPLGDPNNMGSPERR